MSALFSFMTFGVELIKKDSINRLFQGAVYCVPCGNCNQKHFGETKRSFNTRKKEHISYTKQFCPKKVRLLNTH